MNRDMFAGKWHQLKMKAKQKWAKLTDEDIAHINGKFDELSTKLQHRYGWAKDKADQEISAWCAYCDKECKSCDSDLHKKGNGFDKKRKAG